ncbi:MAG: S8 family serine peptidase [Polyangiaceae bacterium]
MTLSSSAPKALRWPRARSRSARWILALVGATLAATAAPSLEVRADAPARPLARWLGRAIAEEDGRVPITFALPPGVNAADLGAREVAPGIGALRLPPEDVPTFGDLHPQISLLTGPPKQMLLDKSVPASGAYQFWQQTNQARGAGAIVGVVDTGIDLTHPAFRTDDGKTRVAWLITWGNPRGVHADVEDAMGCNDPSQSPCAVYSREDIDDMLAHPNNLPEDVRDLVGHGTHVASIAAGNGRRFANGIPVHVGMAPAAQLVIAAPSRTGGFPDDVVLRGTKFIFDRADRMGLPAVVNLSIGGDFGPHDGTSVLERGLSAFVGDDKPGRAIVVAAGNGGGLYQIQDLQPIGIHTVTHVGSHAPVRVPIITPGANTGQVFVWLTFSAGSEISVGLDGPEGRWIGQVAPGHDAGYGSSTDPASATIVNNEVNDKSSLSADTNGAVIAWRGEWADGDFAVTLEGEGDANLWLVPVGETADIGTFFAQGVVQGTIASPATAPGLMAVGCTVNRTDWTTFTGDDIALADEEAPDDVCFFSGAGPTAAGVPKPEILAPGGFIAAALSTDADPRTHEGSIFDPGGCPEGIDDCYVVEDGYAVTAGTSMSAPHAAGAVALLFEQQPNLTQAQVTEILRASARHPTGHIPYSSQLGPGALDLRHALQVMKDESLEITTPPDPAQSWWSAGVDRARPTADDVIPATIQLRRPDGTVASALDGTLLQVIVDNGVVVSPPRKALHGTFDFTMRADAGAGGKVMHVSVLYDGVPIGVDADIPIEVDPWIGKAEPTVTGGCVLTIARDDRSGWSGLAGGVVAAAALATAARRRRRRA